MKRKCISLLLVLTLVLCLCPMALADGEAPVAVKAETGDGSAVVTFSVPENSQQKNGRLIYRYAQGLDLVSAQVLLPDGAGITDLDTATEGRVSFAWACYEAQEGGTALLVLNFSVENDFYGYETIVEAPELGYSETIILGGEAVIVPAPGGDEGGTGESGSDTPAPAPKFLDVNNPAMWYYDAVYAAYDRGIMLGVSDSLFDPYGNMTRAQFATILYRLAGDPAVSYNAAFTDVADGKWYSDAITWASASGIVNGYGDGRFYPDRSVSRQEMATMLCRFAAWQGRSTAVSGDPLAGYADADEVSGWAREGMSWAVANGVINGTSADLLSPNVTANRAQTAKVVVSYLDLD